MRIIPLLLLLSALLSSCALIIRPRCMQSDAKPSDCANIEFGYPKTGLE